MIMKWKARKANINKNKIVIENLAFASCQFLNLFFLSHDLVLKIPV